MTYTAKLFILIIRMYQYILSPLAGGSCRFSPSCSHYAIDAIRQHGAVKGGYFALKRIVKCHPWGGHGFDPVPK